MEYRAKSASAKLRQPKRTDKRFALTIQLQHFTLVERHSDLEKTANMNRWRNQPKIFLGPNHLALTEQQYFLWDTASQSMK